MPFISPLALLGLLFVPLVVAMYMPLFKVYDQIK